MKAADPAHYRSVRAFKWFLLAIIAYLLYALGFIWNTSFVIGGQRCFCLFDDEMISMRYARHLAGGLGLVWNPHDPPVEGFTNPLWALVMVGVHLIGLPEFRTSLAVQTLAAFLMALNLILLWKLAAQCDRRPFIGWASILLTMFYYPLNDWALQGTEVAALAPLVTGAALMMVYRIRSGRTNPLLYALLSLGILIRPDMVVLYIIGWTYFLWTDSIRRREDLIWGGCGLLLSVGLPELFRHFHFGEWLPNTYYLKLSGFPVHLRISRGLFVLWDFLKGMNWIVLVLSIVGLGHVKNPVVRPLVWLVLSQFAYSVYVGGDAWESWGGSNRYLSIVMPLFFVLVCISITTLTHLAIHINWRALARQPSAVRLCSCVFACLCLVSFLTLPYADQLLSLWNDSSDFFVNAIAVLATTFAWYRLAHNLLSALSPGLVVLSGIGMILSLLVGWSEQSTAALVGACLTTVFFWMTLSAPRDPFRIFVLYAGMAVSGAILQLHHVHMDAAFLAIVAALLVTDRSRRALHVTCGIGIIAIKMVVYQNMLGRQTTLSGYLLAMGDQLNPLSFLTEAIPQVFESLLALNWILLLPLLFYPRVDRSRSTRFLWTFTAAQLLWGFSHPGAGSFTWIGGGNSSFVITPLFWLLVGLTAHRILAFLRRAIAQCRRVERSGHPAFALTGVMIAFIVIFNGYCGLDSIQKLLLLRPPPCIDNNQKNVELAVLLKKLCHEDATVAVTWAGSIPYFTDFHSVDLLGKCDKYIARLPMILPSNMNRWIAFAPGHMKRDYEYSIGTLKPDVVTELLIGVEDSSFELPDNYLMVKAASGHFYARRSSPRIHWDQVYSKIQNSLGIPPAAR